jgi:hypothetical protein
MENGIKSDIKYNIPTKLQTIFRINLLVNHNSNSRVEVFNFHHAIIELGKQKLSKLTSQSRVEVFNLAKKKK